MAYFQITNELGRRHKWTVKVTADKMVSCCIERMTHHRERLAFWGKERASSELELKEKGISLKHFAVTGGQRTSAQLDETMAQRVSECQSRQKEHIESFNRFGAFKAMFKLLGMAEIDLNADDVLYFNIESADVGSPDAEDE